MIIYFIRALLILILLFVIIFDFDIPMVINTPINQLFIGIIVIFIILTVDEVIGFITGLIFLIIYFKYYQKKLYNQNINNIQNQSQSQNNSSYLPGTFSSPFNSSPYVINTNGNGNGNCNGNGNGNGNDNYNISNNNTNSLNSFFNFFTGDTKPKPYSNQPEIPEHYIQEIKNNNESCTVIPYISKELLNAAQDNIYNVDNYKKEIKQDDNSFGIQGLNYDNSNLTAFDNNYSNYSSL